MPEIEAPTVVIVPGAWTPVAAYEPLRGALERIGLPGVVCDLPSLDSSDPTEASIEADADAIVSASFAPLLREGAEIVLVMHSYGALPGSVAAAGRARDGHTGGLIGLICVGGFILGEGQSLADGQGGQLPSWVLSDTPSAGLTLPDEPDTYLWHDLPPEQRATLGEMVRPHAERVFRTPTPAPGWASESYVGRLAYLMSTDDRAVPPEGQQAMVRASGRDWQVREIDGSHFACLNRPNQTADIIGDLARSFAGASTS